MDSPRGLDDPDSGPPLRGVDYRTSARPSLAFALGRKPGPVVASRRATPGYIVCVAVVFAVLVGLATRTPDTTRELVAKTPIFSAMYTFSVLGLVGFVTLVYLRFALFRESTPNLYVGAHALRLERPEGELCAPIERMETLSLDLPPESERTGMVLRFPSGQRVRIVVGEREERVEHDDPWDYTLEEEDFVELKKRIGRGSTA